MDKPNNSLQTHGKISWPSLAVLLSCTFFLAQLCAERVAPPAQPTSESPLVDTARNTLAWTFARLLEDAIPDYYEKKKDWGKTKNITVGIRNEGLKLARRKKPVKHGVWKRYKVTQVEPEKNLSVRIDNLRSLDGGRVGFTLVLSAKLDLWARAKVYQYGVHMIALEVVGETGFDLSLDCEVGVQLGSENGKSNVEVDPHVADARLALRDFRIKRVSNAKGPLVRELGEEVQNVVERELQGPKLTAKLNRAIDKKRDRLEFSLPGFVTSSWWPLANLPDVQDAIEDERLLVR
ncbi:MAG: hypothetical protein ACR2NU_10615 [Aeoliella sp.]